MSHAIEIRGLHKHFGAVKADDGIDLAVAGGEVYGLLGPNGAGKTTTIRVLLGYLKALAGSATILGGDARDPAVRRRIGYLPGDLRIEPRAKVGGLLKWYARLRGGVDAAYVEQLCRRLELDTEREFRELSKGNRQKVGVVQAVMHRPEVLVLDEPTSGLDPLKQREVLAIVGEFREAGAAVFFSSHLIFEVEQIADRVGILRSGKLVVEDTVAGLQDFTAQQSLHIRFAHQVAQDAFADMPAVQSARVAGTSADLVIRDDLPGVLRRLADLGAVHLSSDPLVLDDIFYEVFEAAPAPAGAVSAATGDTAAAGTSQDRP
jgi:ABC-2 type transport system ATP-binding protein